MDTFCPTDTSSKRDSPALTHATSYVEMDALHCASEQTVRALLFALCNDDRVRHDALRLLDILQPTAKLMAASPEYGILRAKRKAEAGLAICVQCRGPFSEKDNANKECMYHSGEMEVDYEDDFWADHDEDCHGVIDTDEMREEFPDGFVWSCCQKRGDEQGCQSGNHQSNPDLSKKGRYESESSNMGESEEEGEEEEEEEEEEEAEESEEEEEL